MGEISPSPAPQKRDAQVPVYEYKAGSMPYRYAWRDIEDALSRPRLLWTLVKTSFFNRYEGTFLGGFWVTFSTAVFVTGLAILWGTVFGVSLNDYFPYLSTGIIIWGTMSTLLNDGASVFILGSSTFNQVPMPKSIYVLRSLGLLLLNLLYKLIVLIPIFWIFDTSISLSAILTSFAGFLLLFWTGFWLELFIGPIGLRFRDVGQLISSLVTISFFFTPIIWKPERLGEYEYLLNFNPFYHFLNITRGPLIGDDNIAFSFICAGSLSLTITILGAVVYGFFARRLNFWS